MISDLCPGQGTCTNPAPASKRLMCSASTGGSRAMLICFTACCRARHLRGACAFVPHTGTPDEPDLAGPTAINVEFCLASELLLRNQRVHWS